MDIPYQEKIVALLGEAIRHILALGQQDRNDGLEEFRLIRKY
jgi:hypothetical protein